MAKRLKARDRSFDFVPCLVETTELSQRFCEIVSRTAFVRYIADLDMLVRSLPVKGGGFTHPLAPGQLKFNPI